MVNRHPSKAVRFAWGARILGHLAFLLVGLMSCGGSTPALVPEPSLSQSPQGQHAFRELSDRWHAARPDEYKLLADDFRRYLVRFEAEDQTRLARAYLAWLDVATGNLLEARELVEVTRRGPAGRARDFALVAEAALLNKHGHPHEALKLLRPLQGKLIDTTERYYATQELIQAAVGANLYAEGLSHAVAWILQSKPQQRDSVRRSIRALVTRIPKRYLERALETERPDPARHRDPAALVEQQWLYQVVSEQLAAIAVQEKDATLAKRVLDDGTAVGKSGNRAALVRLASGSGENATLRGRTVGIVLNTASARTRRRSSQTVAGLSLALEALQTDIEPKERVRIIFSDDTIDVSQALSELAAQGASVLMTGFGEEQASQAARHAARVRIPVLLFVAPQIVSNYAFVLGVGDAEQEALAQSSNPNAARVTELECEVAAESPKAVGFPLAKWASEGQTSLYLFGDAACSQRVLTEMRHSAFSPTIWLGLESSHLWPNATPSGSHALTSHHFPLDPAVVPQSAEFAAALGHRPTWFETLGRDAATMLLQVMQKLPRLNTKDENEVSAYHGQIHAELSAFESAMLWTSSSGAFDDEMRLERSLSWQ